MTFYEGNLVASNLSIAIVVSRFNEMITTPLLNGALDALRRHGVTENNVTVVKVPGAFEIPLAAKTLAHSGRYQAIIALGAVIRGATAHFDFVAGEVSKGVAQVALESGVPVSFGVLTTDTLEQAQERAGGKSGNKGFEAATTAIEMAHLLSQIG